MIFVITMVHLMVEVILLIEYITIDQISLYVENEIVSQCKIEIYELRRQVQLVVVQIPEPVESIINGEIIMDFCHV